MSKLAMRTLLNKSDLCCIILNTECPEEQVPEELHSFFHYINTAEVEDGDWFIEMIHNLVIGYQRDEEVAYMATLEEEYLRKCILAERKGLAEGLEKVHADEREMLNKLNNLLLESGRLDVLKKSLTDASFQEALLEEFGLTE